MTVGSIASTNVSAYQGSGLEREVPANNVHNISETAPDTTGTSSDTKNANGLTDGTPVDIQESKNTNDSIKRAVEQINKKANNSEAVFGIHEATNRVTIKIVDKTTKEVLKEFPPEETLDMIAKAWELAGLMVDEKR